VVSGWANGQEITMVTSSVRNARAIKTQQKTWGRTMKINIDIRAFSALAAMTMAPVVANAASALHAVIVHDDAMVSDSALNVTWADIAPPNGVVDIASAQAWVDNLNTLVNADATIGYGGYTDWTLPTGDGSDTALAGNCVPDGFAADGEGCGTPTSKPANQLGHLFITELGNLPGGSGNNNPYTPHFVPFTSLLYGDGYWSSSPCVPTGSGACPASTYWFFATVYMYEYWNGASTVVAVRPGQTFAAPTVAPTVTGTQGANGWYVTLPKITWRVTGNAAPVTSGCGPVIAPNTTGTTYTCAATSSLGSATDSAIVKVDTVKPVVTITTPANGAAYALKSTVLASYACADATSGVASCSGTRAVGAKVPTGTMGTHTFHVEAIDNAGNRAGQTVSYTVQ
jgi:hypothetical protein